VLDRYLDCFRGQIKDFFGLEPPVGDLLAYAAPELPVVRLGIDAVPPHFLSLLLDK